MSKTPQTEKALQQYLRREALKAGGTFDKLESRSRQGFPDCLIVAGGRCWFVELKSPSGNGVLSSNQIRVAADLKAHGADTRVISQVYEVDALIREVLSHAKA